MATVMTREDHAGQATRPIYRFTVEQYHQMIRAGIFSARERVELLEGVVVARMTHNPPHDGTVWLVQTVLLALLPADWVLRVQSAITTAESEPEPDLVLAHGPGTRYVRSHPRPRDVALVVEVADTTLLEDRVTKGRLYARARIPIYWLVNLPEARIEVYSQPRAGRAPVYRQRQDYAGDAEVPVILDGNEVGRLAAHRLLPPEE